MRIFFAPIPFIAAVFVLSPAHAAEVVADAKLTAVTVYPDQAMVTRTAKLKLEPGAHTVLMRDIVTEIDERTLRVEAEGTAQMRLFGAQVKRRHVEEVPAAREAELKKEIRALEDKVRAQNDRKAALAEEKRFFSALVNFSGVEVPREIQTKMPAVKDLDELHRFIAAKLRENAAAVMEADLAARDLGTKLDVLRKELAQVGGHAKKLLTSIEIEIEVKRAGGATVSASYTVRGASWSPVYDARADLEKGKVELVSYGVVRQSTGEEWTDVEMTLSTARPSIGGRMPRVEPWVLRPYVPPRPISESRARGGRGGMPAPASVPMQTMAFSKEEADIAAAPPPEPEAASVAYSAAEEKGVAVLYRLPRKMTVKSDGTDHKAPVSSQELSAVFEYSAWPRASTHAYLGSRVRNRDDLRLMAGPMNVFYEGGFVGQSGLDGIGPGEEFEVHLGVDDNVKVERKLVEKKIEDNDGIFSSSKKALYRYRITAENYKTKKITVNLYESMPVAEHEKIDIGISKVNPEPKKKDWDNRKGVWKWEIDLNPREKKEIVYQFTVEHPRNMTVEGL
ncbi:MAG: mucoidy inhibitor MuiA family protein [Deltaproteobacteria bacterium]|nr:mucoidy inhibitor MuiA family protein [Deltaproteobacteria bacterium]